MALAHMSKKSTTDSIPMKTFCIRLDLDSMMWMSLIAAKHGQLGSAAPIRYALRQTAIAEGLLKERKA